MKENQPKKIIISSKDRQILKIGLAERQRIRRRKEDERRQIYFK